MTKSELQAFIKNLGLDQKFEKLLLQVGEDSQQVTPQLLAGLADMLENYANYQNKLADSYDAVVAKLENIGSQFQQLNEKELEEKTAVINQIQEQALVTIKQQIEQLKNK